MPTLRQGLREQGDCAADATEWRGVASTTTLFRCAEYLQIDECQLLPLLLDEASGLNELAPLSAQDRQLIGPLRVYPSDGSSRPLPARLEVLLATGQLLSDGELALLFCPRSGFGRTSTQQGRLERGNRYSLEPRILVEIRRGRNVGHGRHFGRCVGPGLRILVPMARRRQFEQQTRADHARVPRRSRSWPAARVHAKSLERRLPDSESVEDRAERHGLPRAYAPELPRVHPHVRGRHGHPRQALMACFYPALHEFVLAVRHGIRRQRARLELCSR
jgi:hypothetical protein